MLMAEQEVEMLNLENPLIMEKRPSLITHHAEITTSGR